MDQRPNIDPVKMGGKRTVMSLAIIAAIAIILILLIRFMVL